MEIIATNLNFRNRRLATAVKEGNAEALQQLARDCAAAGAHRLAIIPQPGQRNVADLMRFAIDAVQKVVDLPLALCCDDPKTLQAALKACKRPPLINYVSFEQEKLDILPLAAAARAEVTLLAVQKGIPDDVDESLHLASVLVGAAAEAGIPHERMYLDPMAVHVTADVGQHHAQTVIEFFRALPDAFDPPVKGVCWLSNISAGAPRQVRPAINSVFLAMLAGLGVSTVYLDVLERETMRSLRVIRVLQNDLLYSDAEAQIR